MKKQEFIKGTTDSEFLVIGRRRQVVLAIRPLITFGAARTHIGFRIRAELESGGITPTNKVEYICGVYPLPFTNVGDCHVSFTAGAVVRSEKGALLEALSGKNNICGDTLARIKEFVEVDDAGTAIGWMQDWYMKAIEDHYAYIPEEGDNVISFPKKGEALK